MNKDLHDSIVNELEAYRNDPAHFIAAEIRTEERYQLGELYSQYYQEKSISEKEFQKLAEEQRSPLLKFAVSLVPYIRTKWSIEYLQFTYGHEEIRSNRRINGNNIVLYDTDPIEVRFADDRFFIQSIEDFVKWIDELIGVG